MKRRRFVDFCLLVVSVLAALMLASVGIAAAADTYPSKPLRYVINLAPGGYGDITARVVTQKMGENMGQRIVVENKPGAGMIPSLMTVLQAPADGYTWG